MPGQGPEAHTSSQDASIMNPMPQSKKRPNCLRLATLVLLLALTGTARAADAIRIGGTGTALGAIQLIAEKFSQSNPGAQITAIANLGSAGAIKAVSSG